MTTNRVSTNTKGPLFWIVIVALGFSLAALAVGVTALSVGLAATRSSAETAQKQADTAQADTDRLRAQVDSAIKVREAQVAATNEHVRADTCLVLNSQTLRTDPSMKGLRNDLGCGPYRP